MKTKNAADLSIASEYNARAVEFLRLHGIKFSAVLSDTKSPAWEDEEKNHLARHHFRVSFHKPQGKPTHKAFDVIKGGRVIDTVFYSAGANVTAEEVLRGLQNHDGVDCDSVRRAYRRAPRLAFDFWASHNDWKNGVKTVSAYDVLACISSDAFCPDTFADFCAEFGYDQDSRKAEKLFRRCSSFARRIKKFFTEEEITELSEIQ